MPKKMLAKSLVYQIKVTLCGFEPLIWRRVQVKDCSLAKLHGVIQLAMGWEFSHLYAFDIDGESYGDSEWIDYLSEQKEARDVKLRQLVENEHIQFKYVYDFGDSWEHLIEIEETRLPKPGDKYPLCIDGARACPPEDCGGVWGYADLLVAIEDKNHAQHDDSLEWLGDEFDKEEFTVLAVNERLRRWR